MKFILNALLTRQITKNKTGNKAHRKIAKAQDQLLRAGKPISGLLLRVDKKK